MFPQQVPRCSPTHCSSFSASSTSSVLGNIRVYPGTKRGYTCSPTTVCTPVSFATLGTSGNAGTKRGYTCTRCCTTFPTTGNKRYTCTCALYPGTKSGPTHYGVASYRRRGCSTRWGTSLYPGTKRGYKCSHVFPNVANRLRPRRSTTRPVLQRAFSGVPVYTPYAVARGIW